MSYQAFQVGGDSLSLFLCLMVSTARNDNRFLVMSLPNANSSVLILEIELYSYIRTYRRFRHPGDNILLRAREFASQQESTKGSLIELANKFLGPAYEFDGHGGRVSSKSAANLKVRFKFVSLGLLPVQWENQHAPCKIFSASCMHKRMATKFIHIISQEKVCFTFFQIYLLINNCLYCFVDIRLW